MPYLVHRHTLQVQNPLLPRYAVVFIRHRPVIGTIKTYLPYTHIRTFFQPYRAYPIQLLRNTFCETVEPYFDVGLFVGCLRQIQNPCGRRPASEGISEHFSHAFWDFTLGKKTVGEVSLAEPSVLVAGQRLVVDEAWETLVRDTATW
ncbi:hypothetical protein V8G54_017314 [Vigna mungo]|uniref:Uncharacterized protein n=1 Tax=Vigna mungo TaxID=3915 RepID=A0AAQ3S227_VIGMU